VSAAAFAQDAQDEFVFFDKLMGDGLYELASAEMEGFLQKNPGHPGAPDLFWKLERCYLRMDRPASAMERAKSFAEAVPEDERVCPSLLDAARAGAKAGMLPESAELLDILLRDHADCGQRGEAVLLSARIRRGQGDRAGAHQLLGWLIDHSSDPELLGKALYERADLRGEEDPESARPDYNTLKATLPDHPLAGFASLGLARLDHAQGHPDRALVELEWLLARFEQKDLLRPALELKADWLEEIGRLPDAAEALAELRRRFPGRPDAIDSILRESDLLRRAGRPGDALRRVEDGLRAEAANPRLLLAEAPLVEAAGRPSEALDIWRRAIQADPQGPSGLEAAGALFDRLLSEDPRDEVPGLAVQLFAGLEDPLQRARRRLQLGSYYEGRGDAKRARRSWEAVEGEDDRGPIFQESLFRRALLEEKESRWDDAEALLDRLQLEFGGSAWGLRARDRLDALHRFNRVDLKTAVDRLLSILQEDIPEPDRSFGVGRVLYEELKDFSRATELFESLSAELSDSSLASKALMEAGLAASREASKLALDDDAASSNWRERALALFDRAEAGASAASMERIDLERTLLEVQGIPEVVDRLPLLESFLEKWPESTLAWEIHFMRGRILSDLDSDSGRREALASFRAALAGSPPPERAFAVRLALGQAAQASEDWEAARAQYSILAQDAPSRYEGVEAVYGLGELAEREKHYGDAIGYFETYLEKASGSPRTPRCLIHLGDCRFFLADWAAARDAYMRLFKQWPDSPYADDAAFRWALSEERLGHREALRERLRWLAENGSERFRREAHWRLSKLAEEDGDASEQESRLKELIAMGWTGRYALDAGLTLSAMLLKSGRGGEAEALCDSLLQLGRSGEDRPLLEARRIRALLLSGKGEEALAAWKKLEEASPPPEEESAEVLLAFGRWYGDQGRPDEAQRWFGLCLERHGSAAAAADVAYESALLEAKAGRLAESLDRFDRIIADFPETEAARKAATRAGGIYYNRGDYPQASLRFEQAFALSEDPDPDLIYFSALSLEKAGDPKAALDRIQLLLIGHPEDEHVPEAMMKVGYFLQQLGQYDRALLAYRNADFFQDREGKARLHFWIADCLEAKGDLSAAGSAFLKVSYLYADVGMWGVTAGLRAARVFEKSGDVDQARILYRKVIDSQGDDDFGRSASEGLARLEGGGNGP